MSESQTLLGKIAALRQRLEQAQAGARQARETAVNALDEQMVGIGHLWALQQRVVSGHEHAIMVDQALRSHVPAETDTNRPPLTQLTARARRLLENGRRLLLELRGLSHDPLVQDAQLPLAALYRQATSLTETALRMVPMLPDRPSSQMQFCEGLEVLLSVVGHRIAAIKDGLCREHHQRSQIGHLADLLQGLYAGTALDPQPFLVLAESLLCEAGEYAPLRFLDTPPVDLADPSWVARAIASHSLTVAQVIARVVRLDAELRGRALEAVLAALIHDVGMLSVPAALLAQKTLLDDEARRTIEHHCHLGAECVKKLLPDAAWLHEATACHHERLDGTGYPDGLQNVQLGSLTRLLAVCDVYAACCAARPHRLARQTRTALTDTLLLAERGALDREHAERLLSLSFYPVGSIVELADGSVAAVVATPQARSEMSSPSRPVIAQLTTPQGEFLPAPRYLDLAHTESHSIVRSLSGHERHTLLHSRYPEWV